MVTPAALVVHLHGGGKGALLALAFPGQGAHLGLVAVHALDVGQDAAAGGLEDDQPARPMGQTPFTLESNRVNPYSPARLKDWARPGPAPMIIIKKIIAAARIALIAHPSSSPDLNPRTADLPHNSPSVRPN